MFCGSVFGTAASHTEICTTTELQLQRPVAEKGQSLTRVLAEQSAPKS